ncbi:MAG: energy transducer TonB [Bacteroidales bacterium]|jgi:TonB family protein|nr:energy transducer TonB [Bacteroidales bacterium]
MKTPLFCSLIALVFVLFACETTIAQEIPHEDSTTTYVLFAVKKDGAITGVKLFRSSGNPTFDAEALRVVRNMGAWKGEAVKQKTWFVLPIRFSLSETPQRDRVQTEAINNVILFFKIMYICKNNEL